MLDWINTLVDYAHTKADGLTVIWTVAIGIIAALIFISKSIFNGIFHKSNSSNTKETIVVPFSTDAIEEVIRNTIRDETNELPKKTSAEPNLGLDINEAINQISKLRDILKPKDLESQNFPNDLRVIDYDSEKRIRIRLKLHRVSKFIMISFSVGVYVVMPLAMSSFESITIGIVGIALCLWRNYYGAYVLIDFRRKRYQLVSPTSWGYIPKIPNVEVRLIDTKEGWLTSLVIAEQPVVQRLDKVKTDHPDLLSFASSLQWQLGHPVEIAEGVFISR